MTPCPFCGEVYICKVEQPRPTPTSYLDICPRCHGTGNESKRGWFWHRTCGLCSGGGSVWARPTRDH